MEGEIKEFASEKEQIDGDTVDQSIFRTATGRFESFLICFRSIAYFSKLPEKWFFVWYFVRVRGNSMDKTWQRSSRLRSESVENWNILKYYLKYY